MTIKKILSGFIKAILVVGVVFPIYATQHTHDKSYRNYWYPRYLGSRLDYCSANHAQCGNDVAKQYCQSLGYDGADVAIKDPNVGVTNLMGCYQRCQGWECDGFKKIRCFKQIVHQKSATAYERCHTYDAPYMNFYRLAWCNDNKSQCGQPIADAYCRRMGYLKAKSYAKQTQVLASRTLDERALCFGDTCMGFKFIKCYR